MKTKAALLVLFSAVLVLAAFVAAPAQAQATRTWVSGVGDDANPCSRTAPCKTFAGAISKTATFGEINCIDPGGFGALTITKSIIIDCKGVTGGVLVSGTNGIVVNVATTDAVFLKGLDFEGITTGLSGINFLGAGALYVEDCLFRGFNSASAGNGILFQPNNTAKLVVENSTVDKNGNGNLGSGIAIKPTNSANVNVAFKNVRLSNNDVGLWVVGTSAGQVQVSVDDTVASNNLFAGFLTESTVATTNTKMNIIRSSSTNNGTFGVRGNGAGAAVAFGSSLVSGNTHGVKADNSASVASFQNNQISQNGDLNSAPTTTPLQ